MNRLLPLLLIFAVALGARRVCATRSIYIQNASFETPTNVTGYGDTIAIWGWNQDRVDHSGLQPALWIPSSSWWYPYADNGQTPDGAQLAFLWSFAASSAMAQDLSGLDTNALYCLQFWHCAHSYSDGFNTNLCEFDISFAGTTLTTMYSTPVESEFGHSEPFHFSSVIFQPGASAGTLRFNNHYTRDADGSNLVSRLALDGIALQQLHHPRQVIVQNPSFEASGEQGPGGSGTGVINKDATWNPVIHNPYLLGFMAGWKYWDGGYNSAAFGVATNANPYLGSLAVPDGQNAFFDNKSESFYSNSALRTTLSQTITGLDIGQRYALGFYYNARPGFANMYSPSNLTVTIGSSEVYRQDFLAWQPQFTYTTVTFVADWTSMELVFGTSNSADGCSMLLDDVAIWPVANVALAITNAPALVADDVAAWALAGTSWNLVGNMWVTNTTRGGAALAFAAAPAWSAPAIALAAGANIVQVCGTNAQGEIATAGATIFRRSRRSVVLENPSFEQGTYHGANPWFGSLLDGWTISTPLANWVGKDNGTGPANNGQRPDRAHVAYLTAGYVVNASTIQQELLGLDTNTQYVLQFYHNVVSDAAGAAFTNACVFDVLLQGGAAGDQWLAGGAYGFTNQIVGGSQPYHFAQQVFTPQAPTLTLRFRNCPWGNWPNASGLLLDGITLFERSYPDEVLLRNPSFEASGAGTGFWGGEMPGLVDFIAGWACTVHGFGTHDDLLAPDVEGRNVYADFEMTGTGGTYPASTVVQQTIAGLTPAQDYYLGFTYGSLFASPSNFAVTVAGTQVFTIAAFAPGIYRQMVSFTASDPTMDLVFSTATTSENKDLVLDDILIWPVPEPVLLLPLLLVLGCLESRRRRD